MKTVKLFFAVSLFLILFGIKSNLFAQSEPVLYFCEKYDSRLGEVGTSDRFTTGYITVMVKASDALGLKDVSIQFDKYDPYTNSFKYYKKFNYTVEPSMNYIYFSRNSESDMSFDDPGIYIVYLLNSSDRTVTSGLIEIISK